MNNTKPGTALLRAFILLLLFCAAALSATAEGIDTEPSAHYASLSADDAALYNPALAGDAAALAAKAYGWEYAALAEEGYFDFSEIRHGFVNPGEGQAALGELLHMLVSDYGTPNGFACARRVIIDGEPRVLICVSIAGTQTFGESDDNWLYNNADWLRDIKLDTNENGVHKGFAENAKRMRLLQNDIYFPTLGVTLAQIIGECRQGSDAYMLLITGHSLGGAVASLYADALCREAGMDSRNLVCYTFAAPMPVEETYQAADALPVFNLINVDDIVPNLGANITDGKHIGANIYITLSDQIKRGWGMDTGADMAETIALLMEIFTGDMDISTVLADETLEFVSGSLTYLAQAHSISTYEKIAGRYTGPDCDIAYRADGTP